MKPQGSDHILELIHNMMCIQWHWFSSSLSLLLPIVFQNNEDMLRSSCGKIQQNSFNICLTFFYFFLKIQDKQHSVLVVFIKADTQSGHRVDEAQLWTGSYGEYHYAHFLSIMRRLNKPTHISGTVHTTMKARNCTE